MTNIDGDGLDKRIRGKNAIFSAWSDDNLHVCIPAKLFIYFVTHLKLCLPTAIHNFKRVKISDICLVWDKILILRTKHRFIKTTVFNVIK